jgi:opacity protein-like surface antigen
MGNLTLFFADPRYARRDTSMKTSHLFSSGMVSVLLLVPLTVAAQYHMVLPREAGPYYRFNYGATFPEDGRLTTFGTFPTGNTVSYDTGFALDAAVGYAFNRWVETELEVGWRWNKIGHIQGFRLQETFLNQVSTLANVVLQYPIPGLRVVPYIGGGVGGTATFFDTDGLSNGVVTAVGSDHDYVFAYQGVAGLRFTINRQISLGVGYTYFASDDSSYHFEPLVCCGPELRVGFDRVAIHMVRLNLTLKF